MRYAWLSATLLLGACAQHYVAPLGDGPKASLVLSAEQDGVMVQTFGDRRCAKHPQGTRLAYFYKTHFDEHAGTTRQVDAGREFVFTYRSRQDTGTVATFCAVTKAFVPEPSRRYRARFILQAEGCDVRITRDPIAGEGDAAATSIVAQDITPACLDDFNG